MSDPTIPALDFSVVRDLRKKLGLTLEEVSQRSGISVAGLSKLERNQNLVELDTLYRLARVYGLSASDLLSLTENCMAQTAKSTEYRSGPFAFRRLDFQGIACFQGSANKGDSLSRPEAHGDEHEICWVLKGEMKITLTRETHVLKAGDSLKFDAVLPHAYEILRDAEFLIIHLTKEHRF
jgi:transcriptional regulator with XRE-family HTH domain